MFIYNNKKKQNKCKTNYPKGENITKKNKYTNNLDWAGWQESGLKNMTGWDINEDELAKDSRHEETISRNN